LLLVLILYENNQNLLSVEKKFPQNGFVTQYSIVNFRLYLLPQNTACEFFSMHGKKFEEVFKTFSLG